MRILHVGKYYPPAAGGIENFLRDLAAAQVAQGHEVSVLVHQARSKAGPRQILDGVEIFRAPTYGEVAHAPVSPAFGRALRGQLSSFAPDVLHLHMPNTSAFWALKIPPVPMVVHWHADVVSSRYDKKLAVLYPAYRVLEKRLLDRADLVIVTSEPYLQTSRALKNFRHKCVVVPLGLDPGRLRRDAEQAAERTDRPLVLSVGRFAYYKGYEHLVAAAREIPRADFAIVGSGPTRKKTLALVRALGLEDRVRLPGRLDDPDMHALLACCDVFCLPSIERTEAFGVALLEAMAFGKPLVTTDIPGSGVGFVNVDGVTGLIARPGDPKDLADKIRVLLEDREASARMGKEALARFEAHFLIDRVAERIEDLYRAL